MSTTDRRFLQAHRLRPVARPSSLRTLVRGATELANAANGVRAFARGDNAGIPAFLFGWPTSELAPWLLGASVLDAGRHARRGAFRGPAGAIALLMTAVSWALLLVSHRRNVESGPRLEDALREMLGADYTAAPPAGRVDVSTRVFRTALARRGYVQKVDTVQYGPDPRANLLEVWRRRDLSRDDGAPVLLNVPGGGWMMSDQRRQAHPLLGHLAGQGWVYQHYVRPARYGYKPIGYALTTLQQNGYGIGYIGAIADIRMSEKGELPGSEILPIRVRSC